MGRSGWLVIMMNSTRWLVIVWDHSTGLTGEGQPSAHRRYVLFKLTIED